MPPDMTHTYLKFKLKSSLQIHNTNPDTELDITKPLKELIYSDVSELWIYFF